MKTFDEELEYRKAPAFFTKYSRPGERHGGPLKEAPEVRQMTAFGTGEPRVFDDGRPMEQYVLTIATDRRDPEVEDDDGTRRIYVKGRNKTRLKDAIKAAGLKTLSVGDEVFDTFVREEKNSSGFDEKVHSYEVAPGPNAVRKGAEQADVKPAPLASPAPAGGADKASRFDDEPPF